MARVSVKQRSNTGSRAGSTSPREPLTRSVAGVPMRMWASRRWIARLRTLSEQIEQLAELRFRRTLAGGAVAQHGGKAVVEMHRFSGIGGGRRALPCRSPGFLQL